MSTISEDLMAEGSEILASHVAEDIHRFGDRILSVEPDNWYGLYVRGVAYALELDLADAIGSWSKFVGGVEEDVDLTPMLGHIISSLAFCITHIKTGEVKVFGELGQLIDKLNQKLPETEGEIIVTPILDEIAAFVRDHDAENPFGAYFGSKALAIAAFCAYVELAIFKEFLLRVKVIGEILKSKCEPRVGEAMDTDFIFIDEVLAAIDDALANTPAEELEAIEEYWLEHSADPYLGHLMQAYQMSLTMVTAGKFVGKMAKKVMSSEIPLFMKNYLAAKR